MGYQDEGVSGGEGRVSGVLMVDPVGVQEKQISKRN